MRALRTILIAGIAISAGNLVYLAERTRAFALSAGAQDVVTVPATGHGLRMTRIELHCGPSYAKLYDACESTNRTIANTMSMVAGAAINTIMIKMVVSVALLILTVTALISAQRIPGKSE